jgi:hypothetical protein
MEIALDRKPYHVRLIQILMVTFLLDLEHGFYTFFKISISYAWDRVRDTVPFCQGHICYGRDVTCGNILSSLKTVLNKCKTVITCKILKKIIRKVLCPFIPQFLIWWTVLIIAILEKMQNYLILIIHWTPFLNSQYAYFVHIFCLMANISLDRYNRTNFLKPCLHLFSD